MRTIPAGVRFQDVDAAGIVFFARVFDLFHDAFVASLREGGVRLEEVLRAGEWGAPLVHAEADYARPLAFGDALEIEVALAAVGDTSITVRYVARRGADACARGLTKHVFIDRATRRPRAVPAEVVAALGGISA
ncbi:MAG: acyl-CoA thioesterase [Polyangiaceae bacterium]|nr:acyl-CoA thioesterase [Polyangiaceae bacterium]